MSTKSNKRALEAINREADVVELDSDAETDADADASASPTKRLKRASPSKKIDCLASTAPVVQWKNGHVACLLANSFEEGKVDPTDWWLSEKLDGLRACWNGRQLLSRNGNPFPAPQSFLDALPTDLALDGELFLGRGRFRDTISVVKKTGQTEWPAELRYHIFDSPSLHPLGFEDRHKALVDRFEADGTTHARITVVAQTRCRSKVHHDMELDKVTDQGGEGIMLRKPGSMYEPRRSDTLLKSKHFYDAEGVVIGYEPGKGRNKGRMGALNVRMASGTTFRLGSGFTDADRKSPPALGAIVTYRFQELTGKNAKPRFPTFVSECVDKDDASDVVVRSAKK